MFVYAAVKRNCIVIVSKLEQPTMGVFRQKIIP